jgi:translation initiation factor eIF-2B subunit beta
MLQSSYSARQLVGSHAVAQEVVRVLREVVAASKATSFEALVQLIEETGVRLADAGTKGETILHLLDSLPDTFVVRQSR